MPRRGGALDAGGHDVFAELRMVSVSARAMRANGDQVVSAIASTAFSKPGA